MLHIRKTFSLIMLSKVDRIRYMSGKKTYEIIGNDLVVREKVIKYLLLRKESKYKLKSTLLRIKRCLFLSNLEVAESFMI